MRNLQEKVENDPTGRAALTGIIIFVLLTLLASNLPTSSLQGWFETLVRPVRNGLGLDQAWGVFAPDPRSTVYDFQGRIRFDDGSTVIWRWPKGDPFISEYRAYHWQKYSEQVRLDDDNFLWQPLAVWLARTHDSTNRHPTEVTLIRLWSDLNAPGVHPDRGPWHSYEFFTLQVGPSILAKGAS